MSNTEEDLKYYLLWLNTQLRRYDLICENPVREKKSFMYVLCAFLNNSTNTITENSARSVADWRGLGEKSNYRGGKPARILNPSFSGFTANGSRSPPGFAIPTLLGLYPRPVILLA